MARTADPEASAAFQQAREGLKTVLAELRDLAHGIHPAVLSQGGLGAALEEISGTAPAPGARGRAAGRLDAAVEATLYFVACEALANVVKHADADSARSRCGPGSRGWKWKSRTTASAASRRAPVTRLAGHGLANIADRIGALDGDVVIDSPPGRGTRLAVTIPCA